MISNFRISVAEIVVWALLATMGLIWLVLLARDGLERVTAWWRDRERPADPSWWWKPWLAVPAVERVADWWQDRRSPNPDYDGDGWDWPDDGPADDDNLPLAPERTWEQMTSRQLPLVIPPASERATTGRVILAAERERRAPWWEAEHRAAYESLGFDYPSGLMARVREHTP